MNLYDTIMKGPPRWAKMFTLGVIILAVGVQVGLYRGRLQAINESIGETLAARDRQLALVKLDLDEARKQLARERVKLDILACESGFRHDGIWGDGGRSYGIAQFKQRTFKWLSGLAGRPDLRWANKHDQLYLLDWAIENGYARHWTCYGKTQGNGDTVALVQRRQP
jgi:hypothetical protein